MSLKAIYTSKDEIPEGLSSYYTEQSDGSYKIDLDGGTKTQADVDKVMKALNDERDAHKQTKQKLKDIPEDFDAEKWNEVKDYDPSKAKSDEDVEAVKNEYSSKLRTQKEELEAKIAEKDERFRNTIKERELKDALVSHGVTNPLRLDDATTRLMRHHEVEATETEDGKYKVVAGSLRDSVDEYVKTWTQSDEGKNYVSASNNSGGGAVGDGGGGNGELNPWKDDTFNLTQQGKILDKDPAKAKRMANAAGKELKI